ncbi:MAG TPA: DUF523 and DUF1722 domain-containing protein [Vicinamibacterales bacterium]|nr:DUF523 and DUF1722 domain-containing protein [Vicinamibacterales bacterium]
MTAAPSDVADDSSLRPIRIGISACLLGQQVRFDGGHKRDAFLTETFGRFVEWVPVCPEVECGLGTPRESMRLVRVENGVRLLTVKSGVDLTAQMEHFSRSRVSALVGEDLSGFVLKKDSPSCGLERVKIYDRHGTPARGGRGLFAAALVDAFPHLPVEEEGRLADPRLRDNFVERVFAYRGLRGLFVARWSVGDLVRFHTAHKLLLLAHAPKAYRRLGRLVAGARGVSRRDLEGRYVDGFMRALAQLATTRRHTNVLQHMAGYFKDRLDAASKRELAEVIADYRRGLVPLVVPITLIRHHVRTLDVTYLAGQTYLEPHPKELMLRNHV